MKIITYIISNLNKDYVVFIYESNNVTSWNKALNIIPFCPALNIHISKKKKNLKSMHDRWRLLFFSHQKVQSPLMTVKVVVPIHQKKGIHVKRNAVSLISLRNRKAIYLPITLFASLNINLYKP